MAPTTRSQARAQAQQSSTSAPPKTSSCAENDLPTYTIDLSQPPRARYTQLATDYRDYLQSLPTIFAELVSSIGLPLPPILLLTRTFLRRLASAEQTEELRGIASASGLALHHLIALNVLLDAIMGCTSGGVRVENLASLCEEHYQDARRSTMLHFRTLDWGMDGLRQGIIMLEFVQQAGGEVIARSITHAGFVGVLTGVRKGLSVSLNYRPYHDRSARLANLRFYVHLLKVLLGFRPSLPSRLRNLLIPRQASGRERGHYNRTLPDFATVLEDFPAVSTTSAYLVFCDPEYVAVLEKDHTSAKVLTSSNFLVATNNDTVHDERPLASAETTESLPSTSCPALHAAMSLPKSEMPRNTQQTAPEASSEVVTLEDILEESAWRKACVTEKYQQMCRHFKRRNPGRTMEKNGMRLSRLKRWLNKDPFLCPLTHFMAIMDPFEGEVRWVRVLWEKVEDDSDEKEEDETSAEVARSSKSL